MKTECNEACVYEKEFYKERYKFWKRIGIAALTFAGYLLGSGIAILIIVLL